MKRSWGTECWGYKMLKQLFYQQKKKAIELMLFNTFSSEQCPLREEPSSKVTSSQGTDISEPLPLSKQISLKSCASSLSLPEQSQDRPDNQLFALYLFATDLKQQQLAFEVMKNHVQLIKEEQFLLSLKFEWYSSEASNEENQVLEHFICHWFTFMGYGTSNNKKYYVSRVKALTGIEQMHIFTKIYKNLSLLGLSRHSLTQFLLKTCQNGWEYFVKGVVGRVEKGQIFKN